MCPRSSDQFYIVSYYIKLVTTSWTYNSLYREQGQTVSEDLQQKNVIDKQNKEIYIYRQKVCKKDEPKTKTNAVYSICISTKFPVKSD